MQQLISELNEILAHDVVDEAGVWKQKLQSQSLELFEFLPQTIQEQLLLERDPHGNVQVNSFDCRIFLLYPLDFVRILHLLNLNMMLSI